MRPVRGIVFAAACLTSAALPTSPATAGPVSCTFVAPQTHCSAGDCWPGGVLTVSVQVFGVGVVTGTATCTPFQTSCTAVAVVGCTQATPIAAVWGTFLECDAVVQGLPVGWQVTCSV